MKCGSIFAVKLPGKRYLKIYGDHMAFRASDRSKVKFKEKWVSELE